MIRKKVRSISLLILLLMFFIFQGFSQESFSVAVVSLEKVFQNSEEGKKASTQLLEKEKKIKTQLSSIKSEIQALEKKLNTQKFTLSFEAQQQLALDLDRLRTKHRRYEEDSAKEYRELQFRLFNKFRNEVFSIVDGVAKEKEFSLILDLSTSGVVYLDPAFDITKEVIKRYNISKATEK